MEKNKDNDNLGKNEKCEEEVSNKKKNKLKKIWKRIFLKNTDKFKFEKTRFNAFELIIVMIMSMVFGIFIGEIISYNKKSNLMINSGTLSEVESVYKTLLSDYYGNITEKQLTESAIKGMMSILGDQYSFYMNDKTTEDFNEELNGEFVGLGVEITLSVDNIAFISNVFSGSAGEKADLRIGDQFLKVNGVDVQTKSLDEISTMIKGGKSKEIVLVIRRGEEELTKKIVTSSASIPSVTKELIEEKDKKIGYLYIDIFAQNTDEQFKEKLQELENANITGLIIDVRGNSGGHLESVNNMLELLLEKGKPMYQIKNKNNTKVYTANEKDELKINYDIVVLIDSGSASASELLASAVLEQKNAELVGTTTYGKGTVQKTMQLSSGAMIKYTAETWLTSKGNSIDSIGVKPTIEVELSDKYFETYSKEDDNQFNKALDILLNK